MVSLIDRRRRRHIALSSSHPLILLLSAYAAFALGVLTLAAIQSTSVRNLLLAATAMYVLVLAVPLFLAPREPLAWAAPPVLASLFAFAGLVRESSLLVFGSTYHVALPYGPSALDRLKAFEIALLAAGFAAYLLAYYTSRRMRFKTHLGSRLLRRRMTQRVAFKASTFALVMAVLALTFVVAQDGSVDARLGRMATARRGLLAGQHYIFAALSSSLAACWLWLASRPSDIRSIIYWTFLLLGVSTSYLLTGGRGTVVSALAVAALVWALHLRSLPVLRIAAGGLASVYIIGALGAAGSTRQELLSYATSQQVTQVLREALAGELTQRATVSDGAAPILAKVPDVVPYKYGATYLAALFSPVPRAAWPEKPGLVDGEVGKTFFGSNAGVPAGPVGEAYWNFGAVGVLLIFALFGLFHRWLAFRFYRAGGHPLAVVLYAVIAVSFPAPTSSGLVLTLLQVALVVGVFLILSHPSKDVVSAESTAFRSYA